MDPLDADYVVIKNTGSKARALSGWTLRDNAGHIHRFGSYRLQAGRTATIHTESGSSTAG